MSKLYDMVMAYGGRTPTENVEAMKADICDRDFARLLMATFNTSRYFLKPEAFMKYLEKGAPTPGLRDLPLYYDSMIYTILERMATGELAGNEAKAKLALHYLALTPEDQELVLMVLEKTWRNGVTQALINQACPGTFRPIKLMLAKKFNERQAHDEKLIAKGKPGKIEWPRISTVKYDGFRGAYFPSSGQCLSRLGNPFFLQEGLKRALDILAEELSGSALDGELFSGDWKGTAEDRASGKGYGHYIVFSAMPEGCAYGDDLPSKLDVWLFFQRVQDIIRKHGLHQHVSVPIYKVVHNPEEEMEFFREKLGEGWEGTVSRPLEHPYVSGRSDLWLKNKAEEHEDLEIVGTISADPRSRNAGKVGAVVVTRNGVESGCHGMSDALRDQITELGDDVVGLVAEVMYHELTPDGKLRHGVIANIRFDKGVDS